MARAGNRTVEDTARRHSEGRTVSVSYFDLNQLELAFINRALSGETRPRLPKIVEIGKSERILRIQKRNLEALCRRHGKAAGSGQLEAELKGILSGARIFSLFAPGRPRKR
jgi:hypothetical protein